MQKTILSRVLGQVLRPALNTEYLTDPGAGGVASPTLTDDLAAIFAATSAKGYMLRLDSAATLRQNSGGTGAVSSVSDPVGYATDLSGNGNHFTQTTAGNRALWNGTGCDFDGAGDALTRAALDLSGRSHAYVVFAGQKTTGNNNACIMFHSVGPAVTDGTIALWANGGSIANFQHNARGITSQAQARLNHPSDVMASSVSYWNTTVGADLNSQLDVWYNGVAQTVGNGAPTGIGAMTTQDHYIGSNGTQHFSGLGGRFLVLAASSALTAPQLATLIAWAEEGRA